MLSCCRFGNRVLLHLFEKGYVYNCLLLFAPLHFLPWGALKKNTSNWTLETALIVLGKSITIIHLVFEEETTQSRADDAAVFIT